MNALFSDLAKATPPVFGASNVSFVVYGTPQPQGSTRAFIPKGWNRPIITSANPKLKPWRQQLSDTALANRSVKFDRHTPVKITLAFFFARPASIPKKRQAMTVRPDADKLLRSCLDAFTGILIEDDAQVTTFVVTKQYGEPERVEICLEECA